jgi:hypothetical protein
MAWGTLQVADSLGVLRLQLVPTVATFGINDVFNIIDRDLAYHNDLVMNELIPTFCATTDQQQEVSGAMDSMTVEPIDEFGRPDTQKTMAALTLGFPLDSYGRSIGWTYDYMKITTPAEIAKQVDALKDADLKGIKYNIVSRIFNPFNNTTYVDRKINNRQYSTYAFYNADGMFVQPGPEMQPFDPATHTHFMTTASASLTAVSVDALITNVLEHGRVGKLVVQINRAQEQAIRNLSLSAGTGSFVPYVPLNIRQSLNAVYATDAALNQDTPEDREIGVWGPATIQVKPYIPQGYLNSVDTGNGAMKPLAYRTRPGGALSEFGLRGQSDPDDFPLFATTMARDYGIGVWQRQMVAALQITTNASYTAPVLT